MMILLTALFGLLAHSSEKHSADIYDIDGKEKLFTFSSERVYAADVMTYTSVYKDAAGNVVATERAEIDKGVLKTYEVERLPTKEKGFVETKEGKIIFTYTEDGKKSTNKEPLKENTLISATLVPFIETHLKDLLAKKDVTFRYAVWFRKEVLGFKFSYEKEEGNNIVVSMVPTNFLYRSLVKPIHFTLDKTTKKLISIKGRSLPKHKVDGAWRDFDGLAKYN